MLPQVHHEWERQLCVCLQKKTIMQGMFYKFSKKKKLTSLFNSNKLWAYNKITIKFHEQLMIHYVGLNHLKLPLSLPSI